MVQGRKESKRRRQAGAGKEDLGRSESIMTELNPLAGQLGRLGLSRPPLASVWAQCAKGLSAEGAGAGAGGRQGIKRMKALTSRRLLGEGANTHAYDPRSEGPSATQEVFGHLQDKTLRRCGAAARLYRK